MNASWDNSLVAKLKRFGVCIRVSPIQRTLPHPFSSVLLRCRAGEQVQVLLQEGIWLGDQADGRCQRENQTSRKIATHAGTRSKRVEPDWLRLILRCQQSLSAPGVAQVPLAVVAGVEIHCADDLPTRKIVTDRVRDSVLPH